MAIHRLEESSVTDGLGGRIDVEDSDGTQINLRLKLDIMLLPATSKFMWQQLFQPKGEYDVDGLTRSSSIQAGWQLNF